ncbi:MAG: PQQ-binding-like beta-propeller repeat protein, partial [Desulfobacterales bacterium]|nr:PQQ-binding-like beta-propeller repeat protein [Desulfobacterales bacterium]
MNIADYKQGISDLLWEMEASEGEFSLVFAVCNYADLRNRVIKELQEQCGGPVPEVPLSGSWRDFFDEIPLVTSGKSLAGIMVTGLESSFQPEHLLISANQLREEFRKNLSFSMILWINDELSARLIRIAPDIESWGTIVRFDFPDDEFPAFFRQCADKHFQEIITNISHREMADETSELKILLRDFSARNPEPDLEILADKYFIQGITDRAEGENTRARDNFQESLLVCKKAGDIEKQLVLCLLISRSYLEEKKWDHALSMLQEGIAVLEQADREVPAETVLRLDLCLVLRELEQWEDLEAESWNILKLSAACDNPEACAQSNIYMAEVLCHREKWKDASVYAKKAVTASAPVIRDRARLILATALQNMEQPDDAVKVLELAETEGKPDNDPENDPQLYIKILGLLRHLCFEQKEYLRAFEIKQDIRSVEQEFGLRAFIGAGRLKAEKKKDRKYTHVSKEIETSGRQNDVEKLIGRIKEPRHKLIVLHGPSGVGKSSILEAGSEPALRQLAVDSRNVLPVPVRTYKDWAVHLGKSMCEALAEMGLELPALPDTLDSLLAELRQNADEKQRNLLTVLIFDQFEEFFFAHQTFEKRKSFYSFFKSCLDMPYVKAIISLREDYLHHLLDIPGLNIIEQDILGKNIRYSLGNFTSDNARQMIRQLTQRAEIPMEEALIDRVVQDLSEDSQGVRPIELQIAGYQLQAGKIAFLNQYESKEQLIEGFLNEIIGDYARKDITGDCGEENREAALMILYLLTDDQNTRPLKTRAEIISGLKNNEISIDDEQADLIFRILEGSNLLFLIPGNPDRYQIVHDYLVKLIRQRADVLLGDLDTRRKKRELQAHIKAEEEKKQKEQDKKERERQKRLLRISVAVGFLFAGLAVAMGWFYVQAEKAKKDVVEYAKQLETSKQKAVLSATKAKSAEEQAVYNLVLGFEEKAELLVNSGITNNNPDDFQKAWMFTLTALQQEVGNRTLPVSIGRMAMPRLRNNIMFWFWSSPDLSSHSFSVSSVSFSPDGTRIASGSDDNTVRLWDVETGKELSVFKGHSSLVSSVSFSPDGTFITSGSADNTVRLWDVETGKELSAFEGHSSSVSSVSFSPDGRRIASGSHDKTVRLWDVETGKELSVFKGHSVNSVSFSPDGRRIASGSPDKTVCLRDVETGKELRVFKGHSSYVYSVLFSQDGRFIVSGSHDKTVRLWDVETGKEVIVFKGHLSDVKSVSFSPDGTLIASGSKDNTVRLWDVETGKEVSVLKGHSSEVNSVSFSPDGRRIASGAGSLSGKDITVRLWDVKTIRELSLFKGHSSKVTSVSFSPDGTLIASGSYDNTARLWDVETGKELIVFKGHSSSVNSVSFSPDGMRIASGSLDNTVRLWDVETGKVVNVFKGYSSSVNSVSFSLDGTLIASGSDNTVRLWDVETGKELIVFKGHSSSVNSVSFSPDGTLIASGSLDNTVRLWEVETGKELTVFKGHSSSVNSVSFSPDGTLIASGAGSFLNDGTIRLWDVETGSKLSVFKGHFSSVTSVSFSPDGKLIISGSADNIVRLWDVETGKELSVFRGHSSSVRSVSFNPDGTRIASGSSDNTVRLWDVETNIEPSVFKGHSSSVNSVSFSPDGTRIASGASDNTVRLWDVETGEELSVLKTYSSSVRTVSFSSGGRCIASGFYGNTVRLWDVETGEELSVLKGHSFRVDEVSLSPDGTRIASGVNSFSGRDNTVHLWDIEMGKELSVFKGHSSIVSSVSFSLDGRYIASGSGDMTVRLWDIETGKELSVFKGHSSSVSSV